MGVVDGDAVEDECGECNGDGSSCAGTYSLLSRLYLVHLEALLSIHHLVGRSLDTIGVLHEILKSMSYFNPAKMTSKLTIAFQKMAKNRNTSFFF